MRIIYKIVILTLLCYFLIAFQSDIQQINLTKIFTLRYEIFAAIFLTIVNIILRIFRWRLYLAHFGFYINFTYCALTYVAGFAFTLTPGRVGEIIRGKYYKEMNIPMSNTVAALLIERLLDLLAMFVMIFIALASLAAYETILWNVILVIAFILVILAFTSWKKIGSYLSGPIRLSLSLNRAVQSFIETMIVAKSLLAPKLLLYGIVFGLMAWMLEGTGLFLLIASTRPYMSISWVEVLGVYAVASIIGALSFLPGGLGTTEAVMIVLIVGLGFLNSEAIMVALIFRLVTLWLVVALGWFAFIVLKYRAIPKILQQ